MCFVNVRIILYGNDDCAAVCVAGNGDGCFNGCGRYLPLATIAKLLLNDNTFDCDGLDGGCNKIAFH
jgi:hypothetical protein